MANVNEYSLYTIIANRIFVNLYLRNLHKKCDKGKDIVKKLINFAITIEKTF